MTGPGAGAAGGGEPWALAAVDTFLEARLHHPPPRPDWVARERLLDALDRAAGHPVVLVAAPAGYGKTTLVAQWLASDRAPAAAWVALDAGDDGPRRFWAHVARALDRAGFPVDGDLDRFLTASGDDIPGAVLPRIVNALATSAHDVAILLDDFHSLKDPVCHDQVGMLIDNLPAQATLVIVTRADPGLRLGRLRASGRLAEIRADQLGFTSDEASSLLTAADVHLSSDGVAQLMERTEGWPAGLYLAALSLVGRDDPDSLVQELKGGNRFIGDYLTEEVMSRHPLKTREFITSMSVIDRFSASLCDSVLDRTGSAAVLHDLERTNMFLIPLDEGRHWYRFHHLFAAVARAELEVEAPERVSVLHDRASNWFSSHGFIDEAVSHALAAGNVSEAATLVQANWLALVNEGRTATVLGWLAAIGAASDAVDPAAEVTKAWMAAMTGDAAALKEHFAVLEEFADYGPLPDGTTSVASAVALIQGLFGYGGSAEMESGARRAAVLEPDGRSPYHAMAFIGLGHAAYLDADLDGAADHFAAAAQSESAPEIIRVLGLAGQSLVDHERGQQHRSRDLAELAMGIVRSHGLQAVPQVSLAFSALGQAQAGAGNMQLALATIEEGMRARRDQPDAGPWGMIHHLLAAARVWVRAGLLTEAQEVLAELAERLRRFDDELGPMWARVAEVEDELRARLAVDITVEPLTRREIEVLRLLQGPMSVGEISSALYLSTNTVKTHAQAVYRKLGVHSRTEAVTAARRHHLI